MQRTATLASNFVFNTIFSKIDRNAPIQKIFLESTAKMMIGTVIGSISLGIDNDKTIRFIIINPFKFFGFLDMYYTFQGMDGILYCIKRKLGFLNKQEDTDEMQIAKNPNRYIFKSIGYIVSGGVGIYIAHEMISLIFCEELKYIFYTITIDHKISITDVYPIIHLYYTGMFFIYYKSAANLIFGLKNLYYYSKTKHLI